MSPGRLQVINLILLELARQVADARRGESPGRLHVINLIMELARQVADARRGESPAPSSNKNNPLDDYRRPSCVPDAI